MSNQDRPLDAGDAERQAADLAGAVGEAARLIRSLGPLAAQLRELQDALDNLGALTEAVRLAPSPPESVDAVEPIAAPTEEPQSEAAPNVAVSTGAAHGPVTVIVASPDGRLDLVAIRNALAGLLNGDEPALVSYMRGRAVFKLETDRAGQALPLGEALEAAFPAGMTGEWLSDSEYLATAIPARDEMA